MHFAAARRKTVSVGQIDITQHPNYKYLSDADSKNTFDIERFLKRRLKLKPDEQYDVFEVNVSDADE